MIAKLEQGIASSTNVMEYALQQTHNAKDTVNMYEEWSKTVGESLAKQDTLH